MTATLEDGEDASAVARELQARAEGLVEDHKQGLLNSINELYQMTMQQQELRGLQQTLQASQNRINEIRQQHPDLKLLGE